MRVTLVISDLGAGGAQRVLSTIANYWASAGKSITLIATNGATIPAFYQLAPGVNYYPMDFERVAMEAYRRMRGTSKITCTYALMRAIRDSRPDVVISFLANTNVYAIASSVWARTPVVVSERCDPFHDRISRTWSKMRKITYPHASAVVLQSTSAIPFFSAKVRRKSLVIPNPVLLPEGFVPERCPASDHGPRTVIAMGRLTEQKGFDILLRAFARLAGDHPDWSLVIWGEGPLRPVLTAQVQDLGLADRVRLPGVTSEPLRQMCNADLFVLSSRYEGFPNVLCEAMACGMPVISFDCPSGPADIVHHEVDGLLIPPEDEALLTRAMDRLMQNAEERERLAACAAQVSERYSIKKVMAMWEELITRVSSR